MKTGDERETFKRNMRLSALRHYATTILPRTGRPLTRSIQDVFYRRVAQPEAARRRKTAAQLPAARRCNNNLRLLKYDEARRRREIQRRRRTARRMGPGKSSPGWPLLSRLPEQSRKVLLMSCGENKKNAAIAPGSLHLPCERWRLFLYKVVEEIARRNQKKVKKQYVVFGSTTVFMG